MMRVRGSHHMDWIGERGKWGPQNEHVLVCPLGMVTEEYSLSGGGMEVGDACTV